MLPKLNPEDYPEKVCCGVLEHLVANGFEFPFMKRFKTKPEGKDGIDIQEAWAVDVYKKDTRSLGINQRQKATIFLSYCPFCGKKIGE